MLHSHDAVYRPADDAPAGQARAALVKALILLALTGWVFVPEITYTAQLAASRSNWAHALVAPAAVLILLYLRRDVLAACASRGSAWGLLLMLAGFGVYAVCTWPFQYAYPRLIAAVPVAAGVIVTAAGGPALKRCVPMLLLLWLSVPVPARVYAALIIRPETYTLASARFLLDRLPGVDVQLDGTDLDATRAGQTVSVAVGESNRGAALFHAYAAIGVFVTFARLRPLWQVLLMALAAVPVVLLCNLLRVLCWGCLTIYARPDPADSWPRAAAIATSLLLAYFLFALAAGVLTRLVIEEDEDGNEELPRTLIEDD